MSGGSGSFMAILPIVIPDTAARLPGIHTMKHGFRVGSFPAPRNDKNLSSRADETELRARWFCMSDLGNASGETRPAAGFDRRSHALCHGDRIARLRHRRVEQHSRAAELHSER